MYDTGSLTTVEYHTVVGTYGVPTVLRFRRRWVPRPQVGGKAGFSKGSIEDETRDTHNVRATQPKHTTAGPRG